MDDHGPGITGKTGGHPNSVDRAKPRRPCPGRHLKREERHSCDAAIRWAGFVGGGYVSGRILNSSPGGCCIETYYPLKAGSSIIIHLQSSGKKRATGEPCHWLRETAMAEVKWSRRFTREGTPHYAAGVKYYLHY